MSTGELLNIEPLELKFPFELKKQISCSLQLTNKTENHVAFKVKTTNPKKYCVRPNTGMVLPRSTCDVIVTMQAQKEAPPDMQCKDKFLLQSVVANGGASTKDVNPELFNKEAGNAVEECKLKVVYVSPPQPPSPVAEGSEEGSSPRASVTDNGHVNGSEVTRAYVEADDKSLEVRTLISKLTEEKTSAIQRCNRLRQELQKFGHLKQRVNPLGRAQKQPRVENGNEWKTQRSHGKDGSKWNISAVTDERNPRQVSISKYARNRELKLKPMEKPINRRTHFFVDTASRKLMKTAAKLCSDGRTFGIVRKTVCVWGWL